MTATSQANNEVIYSTNQTGAVKDGGCQIPAIAYGPESGGGEGEGGGGGPSVTPESCFDFWAPLNVIEGYHLGDPGCTVDVIIPATIGGTPVYRIGDGSFGYLGLNSVVMLEGIQVVGYSAFQGAIIDGGEVTFPSTITIVEDLAFEGMVLAPVYLPIGTETSWMSFDPATEVNYI